MIINNHRELFDHLASLGVRFRERIVESEDMVYFDRYVSGEKMAKHVDMWLYWCDADTIQLGADYEGYDIDHMDLWFSEDWAYPFDSSEFDRVMFDYETHQL